MRFKVDENLPHEIAALLVAHGHDAATVGDQNLTGANDESIAHICTSEDRVLVTLDLDFADIRAYPPQQYPGFVVLRLARHDKLHVLAVLERAIPELGRQKWQHQLWIVEERQIRIRGEE